jgi:hypothetical protein
MNKNNERICPVCKKSFYKKIYKKCHAIYCCQKCAYKGRTLGFTKRIVLNKYKCKRKEKRNCIICGKQYVYRKKSQKYCSLNCYHIRKRELVKGKNNPAYKNGSSYNKRCFRGADWERIRVQVYKRDNYICQDCGVKCIGKKDAKNNSKNVYKIIQCHHIKEYKECQDNSMENLVTLCLRCHLKRHGAK